MRTDRIAEGAYQKALEMFQYSERGFHGTGIDAEDVPVLKPQVSRLKREDEPWEPNSAFYGNKPRGAGAPAFNFSEETGTREYNILSEDLDRLMEEQEELGGRLRMARKMGNFQLEHQLVNARNDLMKRISAVEAQMMANDLGRYQRDMNDGMMYDSQNSQDLANPFRDYVEAIDENDAKIARLEAALIAFAEGKQIKSTGGDSAADPGQSYDGADDEEDDEEEDEDEIGEA